MVSAVTAVDSSGETAKQAAESKKWLAVAALIPDHDQVTVDQTPPVAHPGQAPLSSEDAVQTLKPHTCTDTLPAMSQNQTQSTAGIQHLSSGNFGPDQMLQQQPTDCNQATDSKTQTLSMASDTEEAAVSSATYSALASQASDHSACEGPQHSQQAPAQQFAEARESLHQMPSKDEKPSHNDRRAAGADVLSPNALPVQACGKA